MSEPGDPNAPVPNSEVLEKSLTASSGAAGVAESAQEKGQGDESEAAAPPVSETTEPIGGSLPSPFEDTAEDTLALHIDVLSPEQKVADALPVWSEDSAGHFEDVYAEQALALEAQDWEASLGTSQDLSASESNEESTELAPAKRVTLELPAGSPEVVQASALLEGTLEELVYPDQASAETGAFEVQLDLGGYAVLGRDALGRELVRLPDGEEGVVVTYPNAKVLDLYPHPLLPAVLDQQRVGEGVRVLHPKPTGSVLEELVQRGKLLEATQVLIELARFNRYLEARGFALLGLNLRDVALGPTRFVRLPPIRPFGEAEAEAPPYVAPERAAGAPITGLEGVFTLGAVLYHLVHRRPLADGELPEHFGAIAGVPQVLTALLAPVSGRVSAGKALELLLGLERSVLPRGLWHLGAATSLGVNPDRRLNEDSAAWRSSVLLTDHGRVERLVACVSDGMGGMDGGDLASQTAVAAFLAAEPAEEGAAGVRARIAEANRAVVDALAGKSGGCTFTGIVVAGASVVLGHVGDTRAYRLTNGELVQITEDHSVVAMLVKMGVITAEEAHNHPDSNKVLRALGSTRELQESYVDTLEFTVSSLERLILVSDGVWGALGASQFAQFARQSLGCQELAESLVREALLAQSTDNATALVLEYEERHVS